MEMAAEEGEPLALRAMGIACEHGLDQRRFFLAAHLFFTKIKPMKDKSGFPSDEVQVDAITSLYEAKVISDTDDKAERTRQALLCIDLISLFFLDARRPADWTPPQV
jgi:hypothetical protein